MVGSDEASIVVPLFEKYRDLKSTPSLLKGLQGAIESVTTMFSRMYLVIDGIDEVEDRQDILSFGLQLQSSHKVNVLIVSRPRVDLEKGLSEALRLEIDMDLNHDDVAIYINWRLNNDPTLVSIKPLLKKEIEEKLLIQSGGMYESLFAIVDILGFAGCNVSLITLVDLNAMPIDGQQ